MQSFKELLSLHHELDEMFFEHQRALMRGDLDLSLKKLEEYESKLLDHIADEEELLLAIFASRIESFPVGGSVEIFVNEHRKLQDYLTLFKHEFPKLRSASDPERAILFLLDSQTMFKKLLVHHDTREEKFLYPILDQVTTPTERVEIAKRMRLRVSETAVAAV